MTGVDGERIALLGREELKLRLMVDIYIGREVSKVIFWHTAALLALEASEVINMRLRALLLGQSTANEMLLMVTEKIDAFGEARKIVIRGGDSAQIVEHYRRIVAANMVRLSN